eukprot:m.668335 g.668335  ORF g.668335 m.668335 type:complete len:79 (-) comp22755_c0_seq15:688-924(-)
MTHHDSHSTRSLSHGTPALSPPADGTTAAHSVSLEHRYFVFKAPSPICSTCVQNAVSKMSTRISEVGRTSTSVHVGDT